MTNVWTGRLVRLRAVEPEDWEGFLKFDQDSATQRAADMIHPPWSAARQREWAQQAALKQVERDQFQLAIESLEDGGLVGSASTHSVDHRAGRFSYGVALGRDHWRRGYASEAVTMLLGFMFGERRFHKCEASVWGFNEPSMALQRRLGFHEEGRLRDHEFFAGRHHDVVLFGMTAAEFTARHPYPSEI
jgi:RimJ/RimL family protein N-acetyltransferase